MSRLPIAVLAVTLPCIATAQAAGAADALSGCYEIVAGTFSGMETSATSNQGVFSIRLRYAGKGAKRLVEIAGIQSATLNTANDGMVIDYTLTDFLRTGQMKWVGSIEGPPEQIAQCTAEDGSIQPILRYTIAILPESGTGRFSQVYSPQATTIKGAVEYCGYRENFSVISGGMICF